MNIYNLIHDFEKQTIVNLTQKLHEIEGLENTMVHIGISVYRVPEQLMPEGSAERSDGDVGWLCFQPGMGNIAINSESFEYELVRKTKKEPETPSES